ncbi:MAG: alpha/beta fold hydrolase [Bacteroidetes bacterium]|nr:alpha/beta fold hydrolase [Bacteroidota bacterium]
MQTVPLQFQATGQRAETLVILHGLFGSADNWRTLGLRMGELARVLAVDQRNHGHSPHTEVWDYPHMAADVAALIGQEVNGPVHLVGHSMGGKTAMYLAAHYPHLVRTLTVVDMAPGRNKRGHDAILEALNSIDLSTLQQRAAAEAVLQQYIPEASIRQFLLKGLYRTDAGGFAWRYNLPVITRRYDEILVGMEGNPAYTGPTLFMRGGNSPYVKDTDWPLIQQLFPQAQLVTIPGAGHWLHAETPQPFLSALGQFLHLDFPPL